MIDAAGKHRCGWRRRGCSQDVHIPSARPICTSSCKLCTSRRERFRTHVDWSSLCLIESCLYVGGHADHHGFQTHQLLTPAGNSCAGIVLVQQGLPACLTAFCSLPRHKHKQSDSLPRSSIFQQCARMLLPNSLVQFTGLCSHGTKCKSLHVWRAVAKSGGLCQRSVRHIVPWVGECVPVDR